MTHSPTDYRNWGDGSNLRRFVGVLLSVLLFLGFVVFMATDANATGRGGDVHIGDETRAYGGNAKAYGGDGGNGFGVGVSSSEATGTGIGFGGNAHQRQGQNQSQGLIGIQGQRTKVNTDATSLGFQETKVKTDTTDSNSIKIEGDRVSYQAPKKPDVMAYAPDVNPPAPTAPCLVPWGVSGGSGAALLSIGASGAAKDHGCAFGEVARRAHAQGRQDIADQALELMFQIVKDEAGVQDDDDQQVQTFGGYQDPHAGGYAAFMHGTD